MAANRRTGLIWCSGGNGRSFRFANFVHDVFLTIDNNVAERALRHVAIGRKYWLFAGSATGEKMAATLFTVTSSCHRHGIDVFAYIGEILTRLTNNPVPEQLRDWLPDRWSQPRPPTIPDRRSKSNPQLRHPIQAKPAAADVPSPDGSFKNAREPGALGNKTLKYQGRNVGTTKARPERAVKLREKGWTANEIAA